MKKKFLILVWLWWSPAVLAQDEVAPPVAEPAAQASEPVATAEPALLQLNPAKLGLRSSAALVIDQEHEQPIYGKNVDAQMPIASITKLMTAMVVLDAQLPMDELVIISKEDVDHLRGTRSRLTVGLALTRDELLQLALMASENRAAAALARSFPGGKPALVASMNRKAAALGMTRTHFADPTGLNSDNVSTALDLAKMVKASYGYPLIREYTTTSSQQIALYKTRYKTRRVSFHNSNRLVRSKGWDIGLSKTGYLSDAGRCLVLQATIAGQPLIIVLLDSWGKMTRIADANRIKRWIETSMVRRQRSS
ncbi:MAG: D-alanyl-D-alanine endopeptidase [Burkholderiales bacterium]